MRFNPDNHFLAAAGGHGTVGVPLSAFLLSWGHSGIEEQSGLLQVLGCRILFLGFKTHLKVETCDCNCKQRKSYEFRWMNGLS